MLYSYRTSVVYALTLLLFARSELLSAQPVRDGTSSRRDSADASFLRDVPVRRVLPVAASDSTLLGGAALARPLAGGQVLVNDHVKLQLVIFDSTLTRARVIADTASRAPHRYGLRGFRGALLGYVADSSLFVDFEAGALIVIDPQGQFTRAMAPVRSSDLIFIASGYFGPAGVDPQGRLIYRGQRSRAHPFVPPTDDRLALDVSPDSAPVLRADFDRRTVDTIAMLRVEPDKSEIRRLPSGALGVTAIINPLPTRDEWTILPDGTVAIVRGQSYSIDWVAPDGTTTRGSRLPFDWKRMSIDDKRHLIDSVRAEQDALEAQRPALPPGYPPRLRFIQPEELADYIPPLRTGQIFVDGAGQLWVLPTTSRYAGGGLVFDVIGRSGQLLERVALPKGRALIGFGPSGAIYMVRIDAPARAAFEVGRIVQ